MHDTAYKFGQLFYEQYIPKNHNVHIVEIGSQNVNGGLREIFTTPYTHFVGLDFVEGPGVDHVLDNPYKVPYDDGTLEVILCSSVLEHCDMFWLLFLDMVRALKPGGLIYINAPSNRGAFHRFPVDCYRFMPDTGRALEKWARVCGYGDFTMLESFVGKMGNDEWEDFVAVYVKDGQHAHHFPKRIIDATQDYENGFTNGSTEVINFKY